MAYDNLVITAEARALADAVLRDDAVAAAALCDWIVENQQRPVGRLSVAYVERLEDLAREQKTVLKRIQREWEGMYGVEFPYTFNEEVNTLYRHWFELCRWAKDLGRNAE